MMIINQAMSLICFPLHVPRCTTSAHMLQMSAAGSASSRHANLFLVPASV